MKTTSLTCLAALCLAINAAAPHIARADAAADSTLSFGNINITPSAGTFDLLTNWAGGAYAQATESENAQQAMGASPSVSVTGDFSTASGSANVAAITGQSAADAAVIGVPGADNAEGQGYLTEHFEITGGSGDVSTVFSAAINGSVSVSTDMNGQLAQAEAIFTLDVNGDPALFSDQFLSIGPSSGQNQPFSSTLNNSMTLQYNTVYLVYVQADSEVSVSSVPEPGVAGLVVLGGLAALWMGRKKLRGRLTEVSVLALVLGTSGVARATYVGADAPDICPTCGAQPSRQPGGTVSTSLTEGNMQETYPVTTLQSSGGPTVELNLVYNSYNADGSKAEIDTGMGIGWTHTYNRFLFQQRGSYFQMGPDGRVTMYRYSGGGVYTTDNGYFETLKQNPDGSLSITNKSQSWWHFASQGSTFLVQGQIYSLVQSGDRNGNVTTYSYTGGQLTSIMDTYGRTITLTYTNRHLSALTDPLGRTTYFQYDSRYRTPIRITDPDGNVTRYTYNPNYQITRKVDKDGKTYNYLYKNLKPWAVVDGGGQAYYSMQNPTNWAVDRTTLAYSMHRVYVPSTTSNTDGRGNTWTYQYDTNGYIDQATAPDGATTRYTYDPTLRTVTSKTDANGNTTTYQYDPEGNRTNMIDALGNVTRYTYEPTFNMLTSMTDPDGRVTTYQYDPHGNRTNEIDPLLQTQSWTYDSRGNALSMTDKNGRTTTFVYDPAGDCTNVMDPLGNTTTYQYDGVGNRISTTDPLGHTTQYQYDSLNRVIGTTNALNGVTSYTYDGVGRRLSVTDPNTNTTTYQYDVRGRLIQTTDPLGGITQYGYDPNNNRIGATNQLGHPTTYTYDVQNRMIGVTDAIGDVTHSTYDPAGNRVSAVDANTNTTFYTYDALNRVVATTNALGGVTRYDYSTSGGPPCCSPTPGSAIITRMQDADGNVTFYNYDELDRRVQTVRKNSDTSDVINPTDAATITAYDAVNNVISLTDPNGNTTTNAYDADDRRISVVDAAGDTTIMRYDRDGNVASITAPNGNTTTNGYDALNRTVYRYDEGGLVRSNAYDPDGNVTSLTDALGHTTSYAYDGLNRQVQITDALGHTTTNAYDADSNLSSVTDRNGHTTTYMYDGLDRRTSTTDALGNTTVTAYDPDSNVTGLTDANGHVTRYTYDALNRRVTEVYPDATLNTITYTYDPVGNRLSRLDQDGRTTTYSYNDLYYPTNRAYAPSGANDSFTYDDGGRMLTGNRNGWVNTFGYDGADRLVYTTQNGELITYSYDIPGRLQTNAYPSGRIIRSVYDGRSRLLTRQDVANPPIVTYTYDAADRVVSRTNRNGTISTYTYDADNRMTSLETSNTLGRVVGFGYAYDLEGNRLSELKRDLPVDSQAYAYDGLNRLTNYDTGVLSGNIVPSPSLARSWQLDPLGNWNVDYSNSVPETRTHGPANELLTVNAEVYAYDGDGNLTQDSAYRYAYDEENRITQIQRISDSAIVGLYYYDVLGRRVISITDPTSSPTTNVFFYDDKRLIEEQNAAGAMQATYVYGNYIDEAVTMERGGLTYYYHQNVEWSPHALTDSTGSVVERYAYDAYGQVIVLDAGYTPLALNAWGTPHSPVGNPYLFTGRELDEEAGLYFFRARYYDCVKGRFLQRDPHGYTEGWNLYPAYFVPNGTDPTGWITYRLLERESYGETTPGIVQPSCECAGVKKWTLKGGSANPTITVFPKGTYTVRGSDGTNYIATCDRLAAGLKATQEHEESHAANVRAGVAKANKAALIPREFTTKLQCEAYLKYLLKDWNKSVDAVIDNEAKHGPGTAQPTEATFAAENAAGKCTFAPAP